MTLKFEPLGIIVITPLYLGEEVCPFLTGLNVKYSPFALKLRGFFVLNVFPFSRVMVVAPEVFLTSTLSFSPTVISKSSLYI